MANPVQAAAVSHPLNRERWRGVVDEKYWPMPGAGHGWRRVWRCDHMHPDEQSAYDCALSSECSLLDCPRGPLAHSPHAPERSQ